jgi:nucleotide-binding universal stress UspA family protein
VSERIAPRLERIAIAIDFGEPSRAAAEWIVRSFAPEAELLLVHAVDVAAPAPPGEWRPEPQEPVLNVAREFTTERLRELAESLGRGDARLELAGGRPAPVIATAAEAWGADVIVVGPHGGATPGWSRLGSTAERLVRTSPVPILLVTGEPAAPVRHLLVPVDDVDLTIAVLEWSRMLAERDARSVKLMHVLDRRSREPYAPPFAPPGGDASAAEDPSPAQVEDAATAWLAGLARELPDRARVDLLVATGAPGGEILAAAKHTAADLIVMGRRGRGRALPGVAGSTVSAVLRGATCPVLVVVDAPDAILEEWTPAS